MRPVRFFLFMILAVVPLSSANVLAQGADSIAESDINTKGEHVAVSPKPGWGDFEIVEEPAPTPTWKKVLLWIPNRVMDLIDIFRLDVGAGRSTGAVARVSKYAQFGYREMSPSSFRLGAFGREYPYLVESSNEYGVGPFYVDSKDREVCPGEIGLGVDIFFIGAYGGLCVDEFVDFAAGLFFIDLKEDDVE